jgi:hypothetical protein
MSVLEIKGSLLQLIADISDEKLLRYLHNDLLEKTKNEDWWENLPLNVQSELDEAIEESYEETNWVSDDDARKQIQKQA